MKWSPWANLFLSIWLVFSPTAVPYNSLPLTVSDIACGLLVGALSLADLGSVRPWRKWAVTGVGAWLVLAPLVFWAPTAWVYNQDTLIGLLFIVFSSAVASHRSAESETPPGWSYNPSAWHHRIPVILLAFLGFLVARIMAAFQLGHLETVWDPFFGDGTRKVLTSQVAEAFPVSDAGLGAATYLLEGISGLIGDVRRWRTMPWMVFLFFILVVPAGVVSIVLIMLQPVVVGAWCTLCIITALTTLISIPPAVDEIFASCQFLARQKRARKSLWQSFWTGDRSSIDKTPSKEPATWFSLEGLALPWNLLICSLLGVAALISGGGATIIIPGALITTFSVLAAAEPVRSSRFLNIPLGIWLLFSGQVTLIIIGAAVMALSLPRGKIKGKYGSWDRMII